MKRARKLFAHNLFCLSGRSMIITTKWLNMNNHVPMDIGINPWSKTEADQFWRNFCPQDAKIMTKRIKSKAVKQ